MCLRCKFGTVLILAASTFVCNCLLASAGHTAESEGFPAPTRAVSGEATAAIEQFIYTRQVAVRLYREPGSPVIIPFRYPSRPTLSITVCGKDYDVLFDTGTQATLLQPRVGEELPAQLHFSDDAVSLALLEAKRALASDGSVRLRYAIAPAMSLDAQVFLRDVPLRIYQPSGNADRDYSGAFSALLLADYMIEVNNSNCELRLYARDEWQPPQGSLMLPMVFLPRGYFIPMRIAGESFLFHFDTGFSGGLGLTQSAQIQLAPYLSPSSNEQSFSGWHAEVNMEAYSLTCPAVLEPYGTEPWSAVPLLELNNLTAYDFADSYSELEGQGFQVGGIVGSAIWGEYDYVLDLRLLRLYILGPRTS